MPRVRSAQPSLQMEGREEWSEWGEGLEGAVVPGLGKGRPRPQSASVASFRSH